VKAINSIARRVLVFLLVALMLNQMSLRAGEPALPRLRTETQGAFERYVKLTEARTKAS